MAGADQQEVTHNAGRLCRHYRIDAAGRQQGCYRRKCGSPLCQKRLARKESAIRREAFRRQPPSFAVTLRFRDKLQTTDVQMKQCLDGLCQRLRDARKKVKTLAYELVTEFRHGIAHLHGTFRTPAGRRELADLLRAAWARSAGDRPTAVHLGKVRRAGAWAHYVSKGATRDPLGAAVPAGWSGRRCRLVRRSADFYGGATRKELLGAANARDREYRARLAAEMAAPPTLEPRAPTDALEIECTTGGPGAAPDSESACELAEDAGRAARPEGGHAGMAGRPVSGTPADRPHLCGPAAPGAETPVSRSGRPRQCYR